MFASISATLFFAVGGALGSLGWRAPFWLYSSSLVFAVLTVRLVWQPTATRPGSHDSLPPIPWRTIAAPCLVTLFGGVVFYTPIVELPYVLDAAGVAAVTTIGAVTAIASAATATGAFVFGRISRLGTHTLLPIALALAGTGLVVVGLAGSVPAIVIGAVVASAGTGLMLPTLLVWAVSGLSYEQRGRGTGLWTAAVFIGEFICPLLVLALVPATGGLGGALVLIGSLTLALAAGTRLRLPRPATA
ncbi:MFS transporter [Kribbella sp. NPDC026596]|uniref:MFS transporter n=1 Tax=Kribbella sp. NPDC026596 TaxID=3155122 RepID=UPI0033E46E2D